MESSVSLTKGDGLASRYVDILKQRNKMKRYLIRKKKGRIHFLKIHIMPCRLKEIV